jgi:hypothetical protein
LFIFGLGVQLTLKVPNWDFCVPYRIDLLDVEFSADSFVFALKKPRTINAQKMKTAQTAINSRPGLLATKTRANRPF